MSQAPIPLFLNPAAGRGRAARKAASIQDLLAKNGVPTELVLSTASGDLEKRVCEYVSAGTGAIIVAGGDGSVYEAVNGILASGRRTPLGLIPIGTGNDFAKACGIPREWQLATTLMAARITESVAAREIDAGRMNDRYFANGVGIGFDAKVNRIARKYRWPIGDLVYLVAVLEGLWDGVITPSVTMRYDGEEFSGRVTLANISNGPWVGGMFRIAPQARNDDGWLDLVVAAPVTRRRVLSLLPRLIKGSHVGQPEISCARIRTIELIADAPVPSHVDGEVQPLQTEFRIEILRDALAII